MADANVLHCNYPHCCNNDDACYCEGCSWAKEADARVEGREAPKREGPPCAVCGHGYAFHHASIVGCMAGSEMGSCQCSRYTDAATVEACARAAYEAAHPQEGMYTPTPWDDVDGDTRKLYLVVTRAVLAAARGGK